MSGSMDSGDKDVYDDINITPMLDLAYVLMVIFIIMTTASVQGIKVNLPKASDTPSLAKPQTKAITITAIAFWPMSTPIYGVIEGIIEQGYARRGFRRLFGVVEDVAHVLPALRAAHGSVVKTDGRF